eukprot:gb/GFBE01022390.1/.p1 GENE.gb/GFBE01022390.1/~~gb/GFBE01022390.1/.p1  ORF type:complete len:350 (+),score=68.59 gb/GFBE01022390.1/:1-1050(+)
MAVLYSALLAVSLSTCAASNSGGASQRAWQVALDAAGNYQGANSQGARIMRTEKLGGPARTRPLPAVAALEMELETLSNASFRLDGRLQAVAQELRAGTVTKDFLMKLSLCVPCNRFDRIGHGEGEEGYMLCADDLGSQGLTAAYSYGVHGSDAWGIDLASRYSIPLHEYARDCLEPKQPAACPGCSVQFHKDCVVGARAPVVNSRYKTLTQNVKDNGHIKDGSLLLKMDASGHEWEVFAEQPSSTLQKFRQVAVNFNKVTHQEKHSLYLRALKNLEESGFAVAYLSGKKFGKLTHFENDLPQFHVPDELQVLYMQLPSQGCSRDLKFRVPDDTPDIIPEQILLETARS